MNIGRKVVVFLGYPITILTSLWIYYGFVTSGISPVMASTLGIIFGGLCVTLFEMYAPYRNSWQANRSDFFNDASFMFFIQIVLPRIFVLVITATVLKYLDSNGLTFQFLWPHSLPVYVQAIIMLVIADFLRYWLHRACHSYTFLWRLHEVHHSPKKLYWVNTARFHPLEKILQLFMDTVPFLLVGVPIEVLAIYSTFYSVNGFFQHSNIDLKLGFLKYIFSTPILHRWHHSINLSEGNKNFGSNLIVWDILFRTWFLPKDHEVDELGIPTKDYPLDFVRQQIAPFIQHN
jgi:sterol desaturase/sphingolipid hydroxylase (fatty acid hydroxylase superfamily)